MTRGESAVIGIAVVLIFLILVQGVAAQETYQFAAKWGEEGTGDGQFEYPWGVAVAPGGHVYVADTNNNRIQKFTSGGSFEGVWYGDFSMPTSLAVDSSGFVYVADNGNHRIQKFSSDGTFVTMWGSYGGGDGQFIQPYGIAVDSADIVYVADSLNYRIQKFTSDGAFLGTWGSYGDGDGEFNGPIGIAVDTAGNVYVTDNQNHRIQKFTSDGTFLAKWGSWGTGDGQFIYPDYVAVDLAGNVYVEYHYDSIVHIQKFTSDGDFLTKWGSRGTADGELFYPEGIAVDPDGYVYVADTYNHRVQKFVAVSISVPSNIGYTATVTSGQNTVIQSSDGAFGTILRGNSKTITNSVVLNNLGDTPARVDARFADSIGGFFGLISGSNVLFASNFAMGPSGGSLVALMDDGTDVQVATAAMGTTDLDARLSVPADQLPGAYSGNVILTFSNV